MTPIEEAAARARAITLAARGARCTAAGIEMDLRTFVPGIASADVVDVMGAFAVRLRYRWWCWLVPWWRRRSEVAANRLIEERHVAVSIAFLGAW